MVVKVYISGISGNKEVKKRQQRVLMILDSKNIKYEIIDITEPGREADKDFMQNNSKSNGGTVSDPNPRSPLPPQIFNDEEYCGDYDQFDLENEVDTLEQFLKIEAPPEEHSTDNKAAAINGEIISEVNESKNNTHDVENTDEAIEQSSEEKKVVVDNDNVEVNNDNLVVEEGPTEHEDSEKKDSSPARQKSEEGEQPIVVTENTTETSEVEVKQISNVDKPADDELVNDNGAVSSREQSEEKQELTEQKKENPSEALIQNEQAVASD